MAGSRDAGCPVADTSRVPGRGPGSPGRSGRGSRVADFARGRGSRGADRRPPAILPTLGLPRRAEAVRRSCPRLRRLLYRAYVCEPVAATARARGSSAGACRRSNKLSIICTANLVSSSWDYEPLSARCYHSAAPAPATSELVQALNQLFKAGSYKVQARYWMPEPNPRLRGPGSKSIHRTRGLLENHCTVVARLPWKTWSP